MNIKNCSRSPISIVTAAIYMASQASIEKRSAQGICLSYYFSIVVDYLYINTFVYLTYKRRPVQKALAGAAEVTVCLLSIKTKKLLK